MTATTGVRYRKGRNLRSYKLTPAQKIAEAVMFKRHVSSIPPDLPDTLPKIESGILAFEQFFSTITATEGNLFQ